MSSLFRFLVIALITASTLVACNFWVGNAPSYLPNQSLEPTALPLVSSIDQKSVNPLRQPDAPYLQTPSQAVIKMLEMTKVTATDVVYDLGSGDGRIVIAAARNFGAKAIGIESDPELIRDSEKEAKLVISKTPNLSDRIKFVKQDLFKTDLADATVITLYLSEKANLQVMSDILPKLKSGTRIVSYRYNFGALSPIQTEKIKISDQEYMIYLWVSD
jgi:SAM-dependent methyltransferase